MKEKQNCTKCKHFYITWDNHTPKGCRLYGFKSQQFPSVLVQKETGTECIGFTPKVVTKVELDLNDDKNW